SSYLLALYGGLALATAGGALPAGVALGVAFAIRPEALLVAVALLAARAWRTWRTPAALGQLARTAGGFLLLAVPCWLWFHAPLGVWTPTPKLGAFHAAVTDWRLEERKIGTHHGSTHGEGTVAAAARELPVAFGQYPHNAI